MLEIRTSTIRLDFSSRTAPITCTPYITSERYITNEVMYASQNELSPLSPVTLPSDTFLVSRSSWIPAAAMMAGSALRSRSRWARRAGSSARSSAFMSLKLATLLP